MKGTASTSGPVKLEKAEKKNSLSSLMFAQDETLLSTKYDILKENHETLQKDYASIKLSFEIVNQTKDLMKSDFQNQINEHESRNLRLREGFEKERNEKELMIEELKNELRIVKEIKEQELKKMENEVKIVKEEKEKELKKMENEIKIVKEEKEEEIKIVKENKEEELEKWQNKYDELTEKLEDVEKECYELRSVFEKAKNLLIGQQENIVVDHNVKETVTEGFGVADMEISDDEVNNLIDEGKNNTVTTDSKPHYGDNENDEEIVVEEDRNVDKTVKERIGVCSNLNSRFDDEVIVVGEKKTEKDTIMISDDDDSDVEYHSLPRETSDIDITVPRSSVVGM